MSVKIFWFRNTAAAAALLWGIGGPLNAVELGDALDEGDSGNRAAAGAQAHSPYKLEI